MASTYSNLKIELIGTGDQSGTWGNTTNINLGTAIEEAITGSADVAFSSADVTLTLTNTNGTQTARNLRLNLTGTSGGARNLIVPSIEKQYIINNGLADTVTVKNSTGTGVAVPAGKSMIVFNTGSDVVETSTTLGTGIVVPVANGGTGRTTNIAYSVICGGTTTGGVEQSVVSVGTAGQVLTSNGAGALPTWAAGGTITSVSWTGGIVSIANSTTTPAFTIAGTSGGIPYFSSASTWASSSVLAANALVIGGGAGNAPSTTTTGTGVITALGIAANGLGGFVTDTGSVTLTNKTISADNNTLSGIAASSFVLSNASGNIDGAAAQKAIPSGTVVGTTDTQTLTNKTLTTPIISSISNTGTLTLPTSTDTLVGRATTDTLTNKRVTPRIVSITGSAGGTITPTSDTADQYNITALGATATFAIPSGTPTDGQKLSIRIKDNGTSRTLNWTISAGGYRVIGTTLPGSTSATKTIYIGCVYNLADVFWDVVAVAEEI